MGLFYDPERFRRRDAISRPLANTLFGTNAVHLHDGQAHRQRKAMLLSLLDPTAARQIAAVADRPWQAAVDRWRDGRPVVVFDEAVRVLGVAIWLGRPAAHPGNAIDGKDGVAGSIWRSTQSVRVLNIAGAGEWPLSQKRSVLGQPPAPAPSLPNRSDEASIQHAQPVSFGGDSHSCQLRLLVLPPDRQAPWSSGSRPRPTASQMEVGT